MPTYSNSRLKKFEECPRAYKFKYIQKVEVEKVENAFFFLGSRVHETLETLHEELINGKQNSLEEILEIYEDSWEEKWSEDIQMNRERYSPEHFRGVGKECIENYYEEHEPFDQNTTIATELRLYPEVSADGREYTFLGYIDRLDMTPEGNYEVHDYKTSKHLPSEGEMENDRQLPLYQLGVEQDYPEAEEVELVWHYVRFGKDIRIRHTQEKIDEMQRELVEAIEEIERAREKDDFPTMRDGGANCNWCDYKHLCPEWEHLHENKDTTEKETREGGEMTLEDFSKD